MRCWVGRRWWWLPVPMAVAIWPAAGAAQATLSRSIVGTTTPRSLGMADAMVGGGIATTAIFSNPAGVAIGRVLHTEGWWAFANDLDRHVAGMAATDSTTPVAGGVGFAYTYTGLPEEKNHHCDARVAIAMLFADMLAVGVNLKYVRVDYADGLSLPDGRLNDFSLDAGAMFTYDRFFAGVVGTNVVNLDHPMAPLRLMMGGGLSIGPARLEFDVTLDWSTYDEQQDLGMKYAAGGEVLLGGRFVLRAGYSYEDVPKVHAVSAGLGYVSPAVAIDFGFQQDLSGARSDSRLGISARYFVY